MDTAVEIDGIPADEIAKQFGTPVYVYSFKKIEESINKIKAPFKKGPGIFYAVKANGLLSILSFIFQKECGFDVVSGGELKRIRAAKAQDAPIVFAGVGKEEWEIKEAVLKHNLLFINSESIDELKLLQKIGKEIKKEIPVSIRLNLDIEAGGHKYIETAKKETKFGITPSQAKVAYDLIKKSDKLLFKGFHVHLGSLVDDSSRYIEAAEKVVKLFDEILSMESKNNKLYYDAGGGFAIGLNPWEKDFDFEKLAKELEPIIEKNNLNLVVEPGRYIVGKAGFLLTKVLGVKVSDGKKFVIVDAGMNDFLRPALYGGNHFIWPAKGEKIPDSPLEKGNIDIVGPVCETGDFLGINRYIPDVSPGDIICVFSCGAYGASMASRYNSRRLPKEVVIKDGKPIVAKKRENFEDIWRGELLI